MVPYRWYNVSDPEGARLLAAAGAEESHAPVVITTGGQPLVQPSLLEVANAVGLSTTPQGEFYDVVIIGGGPAGLGCGGVRGVGGAQDGRRGASGSWRPGGAELPDRQLPWFPRRCDR